MADRSLAYASAYGIRLTGILQTEDRIMKKILVIVLVCTFLFVLVGCDPGSNMLNKDELLRNTVKIELYEYQNETPRFLNIFGKNKPHFDFGNATLIATLEEANFEDLMNELSSYQFLVFGTVLNEPMGKTLVLHQNDGNMYVLISCTYKNWVGITRDYGYCYLFDANGDLVGYIGSAGYLLGEEIASKYFQKNP